MSGMSAGVLPPLPVEPFTHQKMPDHLYKEKMLFQGNKTAANFEPCLGLDQYRKSKP